MSDREHESTARFQRGKYLGIQELRNSRKPLQERSIISLLIKSLANLAYNCDDLIAIRESHESCKYKKRAKCAFVP